MWEGKAHKDSSLDKSYWQLRKAENKGTVFSESGAQLVIQCQTVRSENTSNISNNIQTECICTVFRENETMDLKENRMGG